MTVLEFSTELDTSVKGGVPDLLLFDSRADVLGSRVAFDSDVFDKVRKALSIHPDMKFRVVLRNVDVTREKDSANGAFLPIDGSKYNAWRVVVPVKDCLSFSDTDIREMNMTLYSVLRMAHHSRALIYQFRSRTLAQQVLAQSVEIFLRDVRSQAVKLLKDDEIVLVPSEQETFLGDFTLGSGD